MEEIKIYDTTTNTELEKEDNHFILEMGTFLKGVDNTRRIRITDVDVGNLSFTITCGCTKIKEKNIIDKNTLEMDISVVTSGKYVKTVEINLKNKKRLLKLKGEFK